MLQSTPPFGVDGNVEQPSDYASAASLERYTQLALENDMLHLRRKHSHTWKAPLVGIGTDEQQFCCNSHHISPALGFKLGKRISALNPTSHSSDLDDPRSLLKLLTRRADEDYYWLHPLEDDREFHSGSALSFVAHIGRPRSAPMALRKQNSEKSSAYL